MNGQNLLPKNLMPGQKLTPEILNAQARTSVPTFIRESPPPPRLGRFQVQQKFEGGGNLPIFRWVCVSDDPKL